MYQNANNRQRGPQMVHSPAPVEPYYVTHDFDGTATLSETLFHAISGAANVNVRKVEKALAGRIDPTALDQIFRPGQPSIQPFGQLTLSVLRHDVTVYTNGQIVITPQTPNQ